MENQPLSAVGTLIMVLAKRNCRCRYGQQSGRLGSLHEQTGVCFPVLCTRVNGHAIGGWGAAAGAGGAGWVKGESSLCPQGLAHHLHVPALGGLSFHRGLCDLHRTTWEKPKAQKCVDTGAAGCQVAGFSSRTLNNRYQEKCIPGPMLPLTSSMLP